MYHYRCTYRMDGFLGYLRETVMADNAFDARKKLLALHPTAHSISAVRA